MTAEFTFTQDKPKVIDGVIPILSFPTHVSGKMPDDSTSMQVLSISASLECDNKFLITSQPKNSFSIIAQNPSITGNYDFNFAMDRIVVEAIEKHRKDDIEFQIRIQILYKGSFQENRNQYIQIFYSNLHYLISQKQWGNILSQMGYTDFWIFEMPRLHLEGVNEVRKHLEKARSNLDLHLYQECISNTRSAWKAFEPFINSKIEELKGYLDKQDKKEEGHKRKSERVLELRKGLVNFVQIGPHSESYEVTHADAELALYQSISLISYLAKSINNTIKI